MRTRGLSEDAAYQLLRKAAMDQNRKIAEVAESLILAADLLALKKQNLKATTQIIGGTGDYAGASGTLDFTIKEGSATNHFNITCY